MVCATDIGYVEEVSGRVVAVARGNPVLVGVPSDPAAQWTGAMGGPAFFAYSDNYLIDVKFGIIMEVEESRPIRQAEVGAATDEMQLVIPPALR
jgi:hypothetical protein